VDPFYQRRRRFEAFFRAIGLHDAFTRMPRHAQEFVWKLKYPDPILEFDPDFSTGAANRALRDEIEKAFRGGEAELPHGRLPTREFLGIFAGMYASFSNIIVETADPKVLAFVEAARPGIARCYEEHWKDVIAAWIRTITSPLIHNSRLDTRLLSAVVDWKNSQDSKPTIRVTITSSPPQTVRAVLDGQPRLAYRAAANWSDVGLQWISWTAAHMGRAAQDEEYPVYVQGHALRQLHRRLNFPSLLPVIESWLAESLRDPRIVDRQGADLLVEYRVAERRLGYLICTPCDGMIIARTFKFLTMEGTPEARKLRARLGLGRRDIDWLRLDELTAFTGSDLGWDDELRELFTECDCGHLFELDEMDFLSTPRSYATDVRRYLRLAA
jgi:hypothetical protein